ncbi:hypothetical protein BH24GEM3_BH24GEM3_02990 [soil metagenome]|jgi:Arc/MetJ family transcription regulator
MSQKPRIVRKNMRLDQNKLTRAKQLLGVRTETEAIDQLLENFLLRREIMAGIERLRELGVYDHLEGDDVFAPPTEP